MIWTKYEIFNDQKFGQNLKKYSFLSIFPEKNIKYQKIRYHWNKTWQLQRPKNKTYFEKIRVFKDISQKSVNRKNKSWYWTKHGIYNDFKIRHDLKNMIIFW